jgi:hypothetical protein
VDARSNSQGRSLGEGEKFYKYADGSFSVRPLVEAATVADHLRNAQRPLAGRLDCGRSEDRAAVGSS